MAQHQLIFQAHSEHKSRILPHYQSPQNSSNIPLVYRMQHACSWNANIPQCSMKLSWADSRVGVWTCSDVLGTNSDCCCSTLDEPYYCWFVALLCSAYTCLWSGLGMECRSLPLVGGVDFCLRLHWHPDDGGRVGPRNVGTSPHPDAAVCPSRFHWILSLRKPQDTHSTVWLIISSECLHLPNSCWIINELRSYSRTIVNCNDIATCL